MAKIMTIAYISSLPAIMRNDMTICENSLNIPKYPEQPGIPSAIPVLVNMPSAVVSVVYISRLLKDKSRHPIISTLKNSRVWVVTAAAVFADTGLVSSSMTAFTMRG